VSVFAESLYRALTSLADANGEVTKTNSSLADMLDVTPAAVRDALRWLVARNLVTVIPAKGHTSVIYVNSHRGLTGGLSSDADAKAQSRSLNTHRSTPREPADHEEPAKPKRQPDPACRMCEGTGWVELPGRTNTVEPCRCLTAEYRAAWRESRRAAARTWPVEHIGETDRPARADYVHVMAEWIRRLLKSLKGGAEDPGPQPDPTPHLRLVEDGDEEAF
jgi:hypothetical protein